MISEKLKALIKVVFPTNPRIIIIVHLSIIPPPLVRIFYHFETSVETDVLFFIQLETFCHYFITVYRIIILHKQAR